MPHLIVHHLLRLISISQPALRLSQMEYHLRLYLKKIIKLVLSRRVQPTWTCVGILPCSLVNVDVCDEIIVDSSDDSSLHAPTISIVSKPCMERKLKILYHFVVVSSALNSARLTCAQPYSNVQTIVLC